MSRRIEIKHDSDILAGTVGHLVSIPDIFAKGQFGSAFKGVPREMAEYIDKCFGNETWRDKLQINFNHSPMWAQIKRLFQKGRRTNLFVRATLGVATTAATSLWSKLTRRDVYNPFSHSVQIFHPEKAYAMKQVGMALHYDQSEIPTIRSIGSLGGLLPAMGVNLLNPLTAMPDSWAASKLALQHMPPEDRKEATKILEPDFVFDSFGGKWVVLPALFLASMVYKGLRSGKTNMFFTPKKEQEHAVTPAPSADIMPAPTRARLALAA